MPVTGQLAVRTEELTRPDGVTLVIDVAGAGPTVVLHHGFAASATVNWHAPGITGALVDAGRHVVAYDARGHGRSSAPADPAAYARSAMADDLRAVVDWLGVERVDLVGYSMGGRVVAAVAAADPRVRSAVLGGVSRWLLDGTPPARPGGGAGRPARPDRGAIAAALEAPDAASVADVQARAFRRFAERTGADLRALAALQRAAPPPPVPLGAIGCPTLVLAGDEDVLVGDPAALAGAVPGARLALVPGDHLGAVAEPAFAATLVGFLDEVSPTAG